MIEVRYRRSQSAVSACVRAVLAGSLVFSFIIATAAASPTVYKYRDEKGRWVMTDRKPPGEEFEQQRLLVTERPQRVSVVNRGTQQRPLLYAVNQTAGPVEIWLEFSQRENLRFSRPEPHYWIVPPLTEKFVLQMEADVPGKAWSYEWVYRAVMGPPMARGDIGQVVLGVPFRGGPYVVSQGFMGAASHAQHPESEYAVDFALPEGTPVVAALEGVVMEVERHFSRAGWSPDFMGEANFVRLLHTDGTMTLYAHLAADTIEVVAGQNIRQGQLLGKSGNTGFSSGPHLHFVVQMNAGKRLMSVPFRFEGATQPPQEGQLVQGR